MCEDTFSYLLWLCNKEHKRSFYIILVNTKSSMIIRTVVYIVCTLYVVRCTMYMSQKIRYFLYTGVDLRGAPFYTTQELKFCIFNLYGRRIFDQFMSLPLPPFQKSCIRPWSYIAYLGSKKYIRTNSGTFLLWWYFI